MQADADTAARPVVETLLRGLSRAETWVAIAAISISGTLLMADVLGREVMGQGIPWAQRVAVYCATIAGMLGFVIAIQSGEHLRPRVLDGVFPPAMRPAVGRIGYFVSAAIFAFLAYHSYLFVQASAIDGHRGVGLDLPVWPMQVILPYAFVSAALRYLAYAAYPQIAPSKDEAEIPQ
ncbi:TRAP transporter small permease [Aquibium microcysteis]|uniref:TRAP transporter small permease n=1 Tax=Aquibium microcysteis TaxID=675281 RepID=UPI00165CF84F|nr:TRAP transporter small permease [Aquibium microcysteis]